MTKINIVTGLYKCVAPEGDNKRFDLRTQQPKANTHHGIKSYPRRVTLVLIGLSLASIVTTEWKVMASRFLFKVKSLPQSTRIFQDTLNASAWPSHTHCLVGCPIFRCIDLFVKIRLRLIPGCPLGCIPIASKGRQRPRCDDAGKTPNIRDT